MSNIVFLFQNATATASPIAAFSTKSYSMKLDTEGTVWIVVPTEMDRIARDAVRTTIYEKMVTASPVTAIGLVPKTSNATEGEAAPASLGLLAKNAIGVMKGSTISRLMDVEAVAVLHKVR